MTATIGHTLTRATPRGTPLFACLMLVVAACGDPPTATSPFQIQIVSGDSQTAEIGSVLPSPLVVRVLRGGVGAKGVEIGWNVEETGGRVASAAAPSVTDANGYAQVQRTLGTRAGPHRTTAAIVGSLAATVRFTSIAQVSGAVRIAPHPDGSGTAQTDTVMATLRPYRVLVTDHFDQPVAGVAVRWWPDSVVTITDASGVAAHAATLGIVPGPQVTWALVSGLPGSPVEFSAVARPGNPVALEVIEGNGQIGVIGRPLGRYRVEAVDMHDNAVAGVLVEWATTPGTGTLDTPRGFTAADPQTGVLRPAAMAVHTLADAQGAVVATATAPDLPGAPQVTFTSTAVSARVILITPEGTCVGCWDYNDDNNGVPRFEPQAAEIAPGGTVAWLWDGGVCDVTFEDDPQPPVSAPARTTGVHTRTFDAPGSYRYRCTARSAGFATGMAGVVIVR
ncbi:MAG TPA: hypothetical protein VK912_06630 [Longimicrobiales bacterium]|nr:hypothetical protein [Longimicrobiales bacterium]